MIAFVAVATTPAALTLGDLLAQDLGLQMVVGGAEARGRRIAGAHAVEIDHPSTWLERDWVMLTTGVRLRHSAGAQRRLIGELADSGSAALGFALEVVFKGIPPALLDEAERIGFPVFEVPLRTPFRDIVSAVNSSLLSGEVRSLQRLSSLQLHLMDALEAANPRTAVLERLSAFLEAPVTLFAPGGEVIEQSEDTPTQEIWEQITEHPTALVQFQHGRWSTIATPIHVGAGAPAWLAVSTDRVSSTTRLTRAAARATAPLLAALGRLDDLADGQQRAMRGALLDELLTCDPAETTRLAAQAASLGIDVTAPARMVLLTSPRASGSAAGEHDLAAVLESLEWAFDTRAARHLIGRPGSCIAAFVQLEVGDARAAVQEALADHPGWSAGIGRGTRGVACMRDSLRDAEIAAQRAAATTDPPVLAFDDFDLATLMVTETAADRVRPKVDELLSGLDEHPTILAAVRAYFEHGLDVMRTAEAMHLHHNSLRYRLGRAEQFLGRSLKDPATIASLYLALTARGTLSLTVTANDLANTHWSHIA